MMRLTWPLAALLLFHTIAVTLAGDRPLYRPKVSDKEIDVSLRTDWYGLYLQNKKIGYLRTSRERTADGIRETFLMHLKLFSFGQKAEMSISQSLVFDARAPHELVRGEFTEDAGQGTSRFTYERTAPKTFAVVQSVGPVQLKKVVKDLDYALSDTLATEIWLRGGPEVGSAINVRDFEPKEQKLQTQANKILASKTSLVGGVQVRFFEVESESQEDKIKVIARHDDQGKMLSGKIAIFEIRMEPEEQAKNTEFSQDLFVLGMVRVERPLGPIRKVRDLVLELTGPEDVFEDGPRQTVVRADGRRLLRVGKRYGKDVPATEAEVRDNLRETSTHHINDPKVKALAARAVGDAKTDADKVRNITQFVHDFIQPSFANSLPTIHDLMERKRGDCKSYALLFTNLARAAGLPAREVSGLLYVGDDAKAFGGHAWNEVVLGGVWVPIDATFNETEINATHLSFGTEKRAAKNLLETIGKLSLKVVELNGAN